MESPTLGPLYYPTGPNPRLGPGQAGLTPPVPTTPTHPPHDPISKKDMGFLTTQKNTQKIAQCQNLHASAKPTPQIERTRKEQ